MEIKRLTYKVSDFVTWKHAGTLDLSPNFQRRPVWKPGAKSYLVDTVVRGLPMPLIFLREMPSDTSTFEPRREVVDGQQRIRTLVSFIHPQALPDFDPSKDGFLVRKAHNKDIAGKTFSQLTREHQQRLLDYEFSTHVFPRDTDDREILQVFARMNATGVRLNAQELRNAEYFGEYKTLMYALAAEELTRWRNWKLFRESQISRMGEVEFTSELCAMMLHGIEAKTPKAINDLYKKYDDRFAQASEVGRRFRSVMNEIGKHIGNDVETLGLNSKTLFYAVFAVLYDELYSLNSSLKKTQPKTVAKKTIQRVRTAATQIAAGKAPARVLDALARRSIHQEPRRTIFKFLAGK